jgi:hypothetical protein
MNTLMRLFGVAWLVFGSTLPAHAQIRSETIPGSTCVAYIQTSAPNTFSTRAYNGALYVFSNTPVSCPITTGATYSGHFTLGSEWSARNLRMAELVLGGSSVSGSARLVLRGPNNAVYAGPMVTLTGAGPKSFLLTPPSGAPVSAASAHVAFNNNAAAGFSLLNYFSVYWWN